MPALRPCFSRAATRKVDRLSCVRFGSARYSVPTRLIGRAVEVQVLGAEVRVLHFGELVAVHQLVTPGETSVKDEHYGGARRWLSVGPGRALRSRKPYAGLEMSVRTSSRGRRRPG